MGTLIQTSQFNITSQRPYFLPLFPQDTLGAHVRSLNLGLLIQPTAQHVMAGPSFPEFSPHSLSRPRRTHPRMSRTWKPRFDATASRTVHCAYASDVQLTPLQLRLARIHHSRRQADRIDLFRRIPGADAREFAAGQRPRISLNHSNLWFDSRRGHSWPAHLAARHLHLSARRPVSF